MKDCKETRDDGAAGLGGTRYVRYDPASGATPSRALVVGVADVAGRDPLELDPLYDAVEPAVVDEFVEASGLPDVEGRLSFAFAGHEVTVHPCGLFEVSPTD